MKKEILIRKNGSKKVGTVNDQPSKTDQQWKLDCDANNIINRARKTGQGPLFAKAGGQYADVSQVQDLHTSMVMVQKAKDAFMAIHPKIRKRFNNDMREYVAFINDPKNDDEAIALGLKVSTQTSEKLGQVEKPAEKNVPKEDNAKTTNNKEAKASQNNP